MPASHSIIKFVDDTTVVGLITNNDEMAYREEVRALGVWCQENNLNVNKIKEMIVDFRKQQREHPPIHIDGTIVEKVESSSAYTSHRQTEMVHIHRQRHKEGATALLQHQEAEEIWFVTENTHKLLQMHNCQAVSPPDTASAPPTTTGSPEGGAVCTKHHREQTTCYPGHRHHPMSQEGQKDNQGQQPREVSTGASKLGPRYWKIASISKPSDY